MPRFIKPLETDARTIEVAAAYDALPLILFTERDFYNATRFSEPTVFEKLFRGRIGAMPADAIQNPCYELNHYTSVDSFEIGGNLNVAVGNVDSVAHFAGDVQANYHSASVSISIMQTRQRKSFNPPHELEGNYYLSDVYYGASCLLQLELTNCQFSSALELRLAIDNVLNIPLKAEAKQKIATTIGNIRAQVRSTFDLTVKINDLVGSIHAGNFSDEMPKVFQFVQNVCHGAGQAQLEPLRACSKSFQKQH